MAFKIDRRKDALVKDSPCLHRIVADCPPDPEAILRLANHFGLLTTAPEPLDLWRQEIRILRNLTLPKLAEKLSNGKIPVDSGGRKRRCRAALPGHSIH